MPRAFARPLTSIFLVAVVGVSVRCGELAAATPSYSIDVRAAISKAGCNAGVCHGNQNGKGGFKLSLRGQDPAYDYRRLTRDEAGRRINRLEPEKSLLLQKPAGRVTHLGGVRLPKDSSSYAVVRDWIAAGAPGPNAQHPTVVGLKVNPNRAIVWQPDDSVQLEVEATFSDGSQRDVTEWAVYETSNLNVDVSNGGQVSRAAFGESTIIVSYLGEQQPVAVAFLPARKEFRWPEITADNVIDRRVYSKLREIKTIPSEVCTDSVFVRRAYLDAIGLPPTADEAKRFVGDSSPDKRSRLIDRLLARPEFAEFWALKWSDVLRNEEKVLDARGVDAFYQWIRDSIQEGRGVDSFVREMITASGSTYKVPAANFYRANRSPAVRGETAARLFLGVRLQCAKCHNHPFDVWTQDDYYGWASLFSQIDYTIVENKRRDKFDKNEFVGEQIVLIKEKSDFQNARTGQPATPTLLGGGPLPEELQSQRLKHLAKWLTSSENQLFVRSQANWIWFQLMGRGVVEPVDDFRLTNPGGNPALLDSLADEFARSGFDLRAMVRLIMNSQSYQASSEPNETNVDDQGNFSRALVRRLTAEQLLDAQSLVLGSPARFVGYDATTRAVQIRGVRRKRIRDAAPTPGDRFLATFGKPQRLLSCECERSNETTLNQALELIAGQALHKRLQASNNRLDQLARSANSNETVISELFWWTLSREPASQEVAACLETIDAAGNRLDGVRDIAWALLNSKEFIFRQ